MGLASGSCGPGMIFMGLRFAGVACRCSGVWRFTV